MSAARWILWPLLVVLAAVFVLQAVQMAAALHYLAGPDALAVSPMLMAALGFKGLLMLINLAIAVVLLLALRRLRAARAHSITRPTSPTNGASP